MAAVGDGSEDWEVVRGESSVAVTVNVSAAEDRPAYAGAS